MMETWSGKSESVRIPEQFWRERGIALLLFALSVLYLWPFHDGTTLFIDEGIILQGAQRLLRGEVLYRDFFSFYTPGSYYWLAARFRLFGSSFLVARLLLPIYGGVFSLLTYLLARRVCGQWMSILCAYLFLVIGLPYMFVVLHNWDSSVLAYSALYCGVRLLEHHGKGWALATGTMAALTCLFEQSKGVGLVFGLGLGLFIVGRSRGGKASFGRPQIVALIAGFVWPWVPTFVYFAATHSLPQMVSDWFWPLSHYSGANRVPYGYINIAPQNWEALYGSGSWIQRLFSVALTAPCFLLPVLPFVALGVLILATLRWWKQQNGNAKASYCVLVSAVATSLSAFLVVTGRAEFDHFVYISPPLLLILGWVMDGRVIHSRLLATVRPLLTVFLLIVFSAFGMILLLRGPLGSTHIIQTRRGVIRLPRPDDVIPYLLASAVPGQTIFVYPYQPLYYFLSGTFCPTRFDYLQLGMHSSEQFSQTLSDLAADSTRIVVWNLSFNTETITNGWPATPLEVLAKDPVRDFLLARYRPCTTLGSIGFRYVVLVRRDLSCGEPTAGSGR